jgi:hypothetical protein
MFYLEKIAKEKKLKKIMCTVQTSMFFYVLTRNQHIEFIFVPTNNLFLNLYINVFLIYLDNEKAVNFYKNICGYTVDPSSPTPLDNLTANSYEILSKSVY